MKKLMILGASILQLPAIRKAKEMGLQVIAVDMDEHAVGFNEADVTINISTIDIENVVKAARQHNIDGVMTLASDMPMRSVAAIAKDMNLVGISEGTALKATNKVLMRECLKEHDVPIPKFYRVKDYNSYLSAISFLKNKIIVKPADNSGSRGVFLVKDYKDKVDVDYAFHYSKKNSRNGEIIVEEYMEGPEVSVESISINGDVQIVAITDKLTTGAPRFVEMGHSQPSSLSLEIRREIESIAKSAVSAIGIDNGPAHTEIIVTSEGPKIVELGARLGGDNITTHLVPLSTGVDIIKCSIEIALGISPDFHQTLRSASAIRYFESIPGRIVSVVGLEEALLLPDVKQISLVKKVGDRVGAIKDSSDRIGFVIAQSRDVTTAIKTCNEVIDKVSIHLKECEERIIL